METVGLCDTQNRQVSFFQTAILSNMDEETLALEERLAKTRDLKQDMMQQLFIGKIWLCSQGKITKEQGCLNTLS
ncbi:hypothetical protein N2M06_08380 [Oceanimonas sp. AH20CE76]|uniref:hypothetical protein n=1 Tax=Oceanimonas sp. AH20CE76 TaxID=2977120 RepID=UPI0031FF04BC